MLEKDMGGPVPWSVLFDHTHHKDKKKDPYAHKKSKAVAVSFHFT